MNIPDIIEIETDAYYRMMDRECAIHQYVEEYTEQMLKKGEFRIQKTEQNNWWVGFLENPTDLAMLVDEISDDMHDAMDRCVLAVSQSAEIRAMEQLRDAGIR